MILSKNVNNKKCAPKYEKKIRTDLFDFDMENWLWKSKFNNFLLVCWFLGRNLSNFVFPFENSSTRVATLSREVLYSKNCPLCFDEFSSEPPQTRVLKAQLTRNWRVWAKKKTILYFRSLKSHNWNPKMQPALPSSYEIRPSDATLKIIWEFSWRTFTDD